jgi:hypothetical protein
VWLIQSISHSDASRAAASTDVTNISSVGITVVTQDNGVPVEVKTMHIPEQPVVVDLNQAIIDHNLTEPVGNVEINVKKCGEPITPPGGVSVHYRGEHST